jgi:uncharacterized phiE125 gp8 family phage protein
MHRPVLVTPAAAPVVTWAEANTHLRLDNDTSQQTYVETLISAATAHLAGYSGVLGRCLINETWRQDFDGWSNDLRLPFPDVSTVTVKYFDADNTEQTVSSSLYEKLEDARGAFVRFKDDFTSPALNDDRSDPVQVTLVAGYGAAATAVPAAIKAAILLLVAHWYAVREAVGEPMAELPLAVAALIEPYRRVGV